ncbi:mitochondrial fission process protein 1 [Plodia interpunctella]|uniref:mitochondrial fission process protein 1 n=1 Tax=Plodia interpunctella TaxID=58824 RepID=UPI0023684798|nr:mitochondrial fission process protein 1 [Plodia interpunctella]XP_053616868.1 mitochondrial fission process protein 1 [Plodia interpunctella]
MSDQDLFRDTWVRYLGYANEVGESFRALVPAKVVRWSYGVAFAYCFADTMHKSLRTLKNDGRPKKVLIEAGDALIWQTLASVAIPGFVINRICTYSNRALARRFPKMLFLARGWITVGVGLLSIPIIVRPIDKGTDLFMEATYRRWMK